MIKKLIISTSLIIFSSHGFAQQADITDYEIPFVQYSKFPNASLTSSKGLSASGGSERKSVSLVRYDIGVYRERYDNKFSEFSIFFGESKSGDPSFAVGGQDASISDLAGLTYASGIHISNHVNWALSMSLATSKTTIDNDSETEIGIGIGTRLTIIPINHLEIGLEITTSSQYSGGGLQVRFIF